jgi:hypothetical protein
VTSKVPPPRSKTRMFSSLSRLSRPYAIAAAVGSLMTRSMVRPAIFPASLVAWRSLFVHCLLLCQKLQIKERSELMSLTVMRSLSFDSFEAISRNKYSSLTCL